MYEKNESTEMNRPAAAWLSALMLRDPGRWSSRLGALVSWLKLIGRGQRRRFGRAAAGTLAGASGIALMALLAGPMAPPVHAATITVNETTCTLIEAIRTANTGSVEDGCTTGNPSGPDTIILGANVNLPAKYGAPDAEGVYSGLPTISSDITIESSTGNKFTIARTADDTDRFRIFTVDSSGSLTLRNLTVSDGYAYVYKETGCCGFQKWGSDGGAIASLSGDLTIDGVTFTDNRAAEDGGAIYGKTLTITIINDSSFTNNRTINNGGAITVKSGTLTVSDAVMSGNETSGNSDGKGGAIYVDSSVLTVSDVVVTGSFANRGGAIYVDETVSELQITNSVFTDNTSLNRGGAVYSYGKVTISDSQFISNTSDNNSGGGKGGALYLKDAIFVDISGSTFMSNTAAEDGGAVYIEQTDVLTITNSTFSDNKTTRDNGGAIYLSKFENNGEGLIKNTVISGNSSANKGGGFYKKGEGRLRIEGSTITNNDAVNKGGGLYFRGGDVAIVNSTISGNNGPKGGGVYFVRTYSNGNLTMTHTTVTDNSATGAGGGLYAKLESSGKYALLNLTGNIISGNDSSGTTENEEIFVDRGPSSGATVTTAGNVLGHSGLSRAAAFGGLVPGATDFDATTDGTPTALSAILDTTPADNGGPALPGGYKMLTHNLVGGSPAIDFVTCDPAIDTDQRGVARPQGAACDAGSVESVKTTVLVSTWAAGSVDGLSYGPADILQWDGDSWTKWFAGTDAGLEPTGKWKHNLNAIWISDTESTEFMVSFVQNQQRIGDLGWVDGYDILMWDGDAFSRWFEGERVGLNVKTQEKIDGLHVMSAAPEWSEFAGEDCEAYLLLSTQGNGLVPKPGNIKPKNVLKFGGEDVLGFCATNLGVNTTGFWEMALDGSADGVKKNNIDSISMNEDGSVLYLTSKKAFAVDGALGGHSEVFAFDMAAEKAGELRKVSDGDFSGPLFSIYDAGMSVNAKVDALHVSGELGD